MVMDFPILQGKKILEYFVSPQAQEGKHTNELFQNILPPQSKEIYIDGTP